MPPYRETQAYVKKVTGVSGAAEPPPPDVTIYKWVDIVDGKPIVRYANKPPKGVDAVPVGNIRGFSGLRGPFAGLSGFSGFDLLC